MTELVRSIRSQHASAPIIVVYEGAHVYASRGALNESYVRQQPPDALGLSAGRNLIVQHAHTPFVMILDDDVRFHEGTHVERLVEHLRREPRLVLAAACHYPRDCYAHRFVADGQSLLQMELPPPSEGDAHAGGLQKAHITHNAFVARTAALRALHPTRAHIHRL